MKPVLFSGVYGRAVGAVAIDLAKQGARVFGCDKGGFPPMRDLVDQSEIEVFGDDEAVARLGEIEQVVVGSLRGRGIPVVEEALNRRVPVTSLPRFLEERWLRKSANLVVGGTNGKTTTTAMLATILRHAGMDPDYLVGGECASIEGLARFRGADRCVLEGDEFIAGFGDRNPKFLYYHPRILVVSNVVYDHPEVYRDEREYRQAFAYLVQLVPKNGSLILGDGEDVDFLSERAACGVERAKVNDYRATASGCEFQVDGRSCCLPISGEFNAWNAAAALFAARAAGVDLEAGIEALAAFCGVRGRMEVIAEGHELTVLADEAYHPAAMAPMLRELVSRYPGRQRVVGLAPRFTGGCDQLQQAELPRSLAGADAVVWSPPGNFRVFSDSPFDEERFENDLERQGVQSHRVNKIEEMAAVIQGIVRPPSVVVLNLGQGSHDTESMARGLVIELGKHSSRA